MKGLLSSSSPCAPALGEGDRGAVGAAGPAAPFGPSGHFPQGGKSLAMRPW